MKKILVDEKTGRKRVQTINNEPSRTVQSQKKEADINEILKRYVQTGQLSQNRQGRYMDVSRVGSYHESLNVVLEAQKSFMGVPAHIRKRFNNDPMELIMFLSDKENQEEAIKLGLLERKEPKKDSVVDSKTAPSVPEEGTGEA